MIEKVRYVVPYGQHQWEIDVFHGKNAGLVLAEIELDAEHEEFALPPWIGEEVTGDRRYDNSSLATHPMRLGV
jgi:CYTH domain-containing protein